MEIVEPIAQNHRPAPECRADDLVDDLGPGRLVDEQLGAIAHGLVGRVKHDGAQSLAHGGAPGLAQAHHLAAGVFQKPCEEADLRRFAGAVAPLEGDEDARVRGRCHSC